MKILPKIILLLSLKLMVKYEIVIFFTYFKRDFELFNLNFEYHSVV